MNQGKILLESGTLWISIKKTTEQALKSGALKSIPTEVEIIEQNGVKFIVRILENTQEKVYSQGRTIKENSKSNFSEASKFSPTSA